jgi:hypothetical protein
LLENGHDRLKMRWRLNEVAGSSNLTVLGQFAVVMKYLTAGLNMSKVTRLPWYLELWEYMLCKLSFLFVCLFEGVLM